MKYDYDLLVIGAGPGGLAAAKRAAGYGAKVAIAEAEHLGGICLNRGCVPKKLMVHAADFADLSEDARGYGWDLASKQLDWQRFVAARNEYVQHLHQVHQKSLHQAGVEILRDYATFVDSHSLQVGDRKVTADKILIAVGGKPVKLPIPGIEHTLTSKEIFQLEQIPQRLGIIGGGYIGVEFASTFRSFGTEVFLIDQSDCILSGFDQDIQATVQEGLLQRGIQSFGNTTPQKIERNAEGLHLTMSGDCPQSLTVDTILCAVGRTGNLDDLGLEQAGVEHGKKAIAVDDHSRTNQNHIFAVGDCTGRLPLTPVATAEGRAFADTVFGNQPRQVNYSLVPSSVFSRPEAATVGLTEAEAKEQYGDRARCYKTEFQPLFYGLSKSYKQSQQNLMKVIVDHSQGDRLLGIHLVGEHVTELIQGFVVAMKLGATLQDLNDTIGIHPSSAEELLSLNR